MTPVRPVDPMTWGEAIEGRHDMGDAGTNRNEPTTTSEAESPKVPAFNRFMIRLLASPFAGMAGGLALVRYNGRRSGLPRQLPVGAESYRGGWLILVGRPGEKRWWRNFTEPAPIELVRGRTVASGSGVVVLGGSERGREIAADYLARHRGMAGRLGLPKLAAGQSHSPEALAAAVAPLVFVFVTPDAAAA
jgi:hypothetical protein